MKRFICRNLVKCLAVLGLAPITCAAQDIPEAPFAYNTLSGTIRFSNSLKAITDRLNAPANEGLSNVTIRATGQSPYPALESTSALFPAASRTSTPYQLPLSANSAGIPYTVSPVVRMMGDQYYYEFRPKVSAPVTVSGPVPPLDFSECLGMATLRFKNSDQTPLAVNGGSIAVFDAAHQVLLARLYTIPAGATEQRLFLPGDVPVQLDIITDRGADIYADRVTYLQRVSASVGCDTTKVLDVVVPAIPEPATIIGTVDMKGKFEWTVPVNRDYSSDFTSVVLYDGPFGARRWTRVQGDNSSVPASGPYSLMNVVPSTVDPTSRGYVAWARMAFGVKGSLEDFWTPRLGAGANLPVDVPSGGHVDLGHRFEIDPGIVRGRIVLQGPPELPGQPSLFRGLRHDSDSTTKIPGISDSLSNPGWLQLSVVGAGGVDRKAAGATYTAVGGDARVEFGGTVSANGAFEGDYELALGGLEGERSFWKVPTLSLFFATNNSLDGSSYYLGQLYLHDNLAPETEIVPQQSVERHIRYGFSEVCVSFRSSSGRFYAPSIEVVGGGFTNATTSYRVINGAFSGTPVNLRDAADTGEVRLVLPKGRYRLQPRVWPVSGGRVPGNPFELTVGEGERYCVSECLQIELAAPASTSRSDIVVSGQVHSSGTSPVRITYSLNGALPLPLPGSFGPNSTFEIPITLAGPNCAGNTLTVTASSPDCGESFVTKIIQLDTMPPLIHCSPDIVTPCVNTTQTPVTFPVTATDDCTGPVTLVCTPPSGSSFPVGTTTVTCRAEDAAGNFSTCAFTVTVQSQVVSIERAVILRWDCGVLQAADQAGGPWTDVLGATSPYAVAANNARKFYQTRSGDRMPRPLPVDLPPLPH